MSETDKSETSPAAETPDDSGPRKFLVVLDTSDEFKAALRFTCRRAAHTDGVVALFHAVPTADYHHFASIGELMETEARTEAERRLQQVAAEVHRQTGKFPGLYLRQGDTLEQLLKVLEEDPTFSVLVLGAGSDTAGPGPIISALSGKLAGKIRIPVTLVPGDLSEARIDDLS